VRLYGSREPETYTFEEVKAWYDLDECGSSLDERGSSLDDDSSSPVLVLVLEDELALIAGAVARESNARRIRAMRLAEKEMQGHETEAMRWEERRSGIHGEVVRRLMGGSAVEGAPNPVGEVDVDGDGKGGRLGRLGYKFGTGLDNEDEFSDDKERAKAEALAKDRRKEEERRRKEREKGRKEVSEGMREKKRREKKRTVETRDDFLMSVAWPPLRSAPLHSTPLHSTPLHSTPLHSAPLHSTPLHSTIH